MHTNEALGGLPPVNGSSDTLPLNNILGLVRKAIHTRQGGSIGEVNLEDSIPKAMIEPILKEIGDIMDRSISEKLLPKKNWTGETLAQHIYEQQGSLPKTPSAH